MVASKIQIGGDHYKNYKIQPFEFFVKNQIPFHKADIIKRILRYNQPTGKGLQDLEKIKHELDLILEFQDFSVESDMYSRWKTSIYEFLSVNSLKRKDNIRDVIVLILNYDSKSGKGKDSLARVKKIVDEIIKTEYAK